MVTAKSEVGYEDCDESFGQPLLRDCDNAVVAGLSEWTRLKHKGGGKPRGLSVNKGRKQEMFDD